MEFFTELLFEILVQTLGEALFEMGLHALAESFRREPNPWLAALGYATFGCLFGGVSLFFAPSPFSSARMWAWANLVLTPVVAGAAMTGLGALRRRWDQPLLRIDRFACGYLFALCFALIRFFFSH